MEFGIGLPQFGPATSEGVIRAARQAEDLGFDDVWVSDHVGVPASAPYPPSFLLDALTTLTYAAAVTARIRLGTSILILALRHPLPLAKQLATIDVLSGGRLVLGVGAGWLEGEFEACGVSFKERGSRLDESIDLLRAAWSASPFSHAGPLFEVDSFKALPAPARPIPVWVGGASEPAIRRAIFKGDGWQGSTVEPIDVSETVRKLRAARPEKEFRVSMRIGTNFDGLSGDLDELRSHLSSFREAGVQHVMTSPAQRDVDLWLRSTDALWRVFEEYR